MRCAGEPGENTAWTTPTDAPQAAIAPAMPRMKISIWSGRMWNRLTSIASRNPTAIDGSALTANTSEAWTTTARLLGATSGASARSRPTQRRRAHISPSPATLTRPTSSFSSNQASARVS